MTGTERREPELVCIQCGVVVELCAFCERDECRLTICYRCVRIELGQSMAQPHLHGG